MGFALGELWEFFGVYLVHGKPIRFLELSAETGRMYFGCVKSAPDYLPASILEVSISLPKIFLDTLLDLFAFQIFFSSWHSAGVMVSKRKGVSIQAFYLLSC